MQEGHEPRAKSAGEAQRMSVRQTADHFLNPRHGWICDARVKVVRSQRVKSGRGQLDMIRILRRGIAECR